jgi:hypothetical protein
MSRERITIVKGRLNSIGWNDLVVAVSEVLFPVAESGLTVDFAYHLNNYQ